MLKISILAGYSSTYRSTAFFIRSAVCKCLLLHFHLSSHLNCGRQADREEESEADGAKDTEADRRGELPVSELTDIQTAVPLPVTGSTGVATNQRARSLQTYEGLPNGIQQSAPGFSHVCLESAIGHWSTKSAHSSQVFFF